MSPILIVNVASSTTKEKSAEGTITIKIIRHIIFDHYTAANGYDFSFLTQRRARLYLGRVNAHKSKHYDKIQEHLNCWNCNNPIFVYNPIVSKLGTAKRRHYHFVCALEKGLVVENLYNPMHMEYKRFLYGLLL